MSNSCIRILADPIQIKECKESLSALDNSLASIANLFNLAGNGARFKILYLLYKEGEMCPCDLSDILEISVGGISQHLRKLKDGGIVTAKKVGQTVFYSLVEKNSEIIKPVLASLLERNQENMTL
jgi:DNA-binding transcriptional ArsR family regulator